MKTIQDLYHIVYFNTPNGQNDSFSAASKGYKRYQTMNKGLSSQMIGHLNKLNKYTL